MQSLWLAPLLVGYLLGSIPFGLVLTFLTGGGDLRAIGSGNIGATNVLRTGRKGIAALTLILDCLKGVAAVLLGGMIAGPEGAILGGAAAFVGHCYPIWLRFRGGKGVATLMGVATALYWPCGVVFAVVWLSALFLSRYSSVGGILAGISAPVSAAAFGQWHILPLLVALAVLLVWKHRGNISRLMAGQEPKVGANR